MGLWTCGRTVWVRPRRWQVHSPVVAPGGERGDVRRQSRGSRLVGQAASDSGGHRLLEDHSVVDEGIPVPGGVVVLPAVVADTVNWEVHTDSVSRLRSALLWVEPVDPERHDSGCR